VAINSASITVQKQTEFESLELAKSPKILVRLTLLRQPIKQ